MSEWQPIESANKDGNSGVVLLRTESGAIGSATYVKNSVTGECRWEWAYTENHVSYSMVIGAPSPTHWMQLPEPPHPIDGAQ